MEKAGALGGRIVRLGSGSREQFDRRQYNRCLKELEAAGQDTQKMPQAHLWELGLRSNAPYSESKAVVHVDLGFPFLKRRSGDLLEVKADLHNISMKDFRTQRTLVNIARHLRVPVRGPPAVDTFIMANILNYVPWKDLTRAVSSRFLKPGGRLVIANNRDFFPDRELHDTLPVGNEELRQFLESEGFEIEHWIQRGDAPWEHSDSSLPFGTKEPVKPDGIVLTVARKPLSK